jgi:hypothetical protein
MTDKEKMTVKPGLEIEYEMYVNNNQDGYGNSAVHAGASVGKLLDEGKTPKEAEEGLYEHDLTGFLAGCAIEAVAHFHPRGDEIRISWNKKYGVDEEKAKGGVVNPAIMTINT